MFTTLCHGRRVCAKQISLHVMHTDTYPDAVLHADDAVEAPLLVVRGPRGACVGSGGGRAPRGGVLRGGPPVLLTTTCRGTCIRAVARWCLLQRDNKDICMTTFKAREEMLILLSSVKEI